MEVIELSNAAYCAPEPPVVMVKKKDGSNRFCIDYRHLNAVTKFDAEPMGDADSIMSKLGGEKYFTKINMSEGYLQVPMEISKEKIIFVLKTDSTVNVQCIYGRSPGIYGLTELT